MTHPLPIDTTFLPAQRDGADIAAYPIGADKALPVPLAQLDAAARTLRPIPWCRQRVPLAQLDAAARW
jgi:hypothetical protein